MACLPILKGIEFMVIQCSSDQNCVHRQINAKDKNAKIKYNPGASCSVSQYLVDEQQMVLALNFKSPDS